ncbi:hypothetical protein DFH28DRAFT_907085, partial [Melampsora americana]
LYCRCNEELRRIAHEVRQMFRWALTTHTKIDQALKLAQSGWDPTATTLPIELVKGSKALHIVNKINWEESSDILDSLYHGLFLDHACLVFRWDTYLVSLLHNTRQYSSATIAEDQLLEAQWKNMLKSYLEGRY